MENGKYAFVKSALFAYSLERYRALRSKAPNVINKFKFSPSEKICSLTFDFSKKIKHITRAKHEYHCEQNPQDFVRTVALLACAESPSFSAKYATFSATFSSASRV